MKNRTSLLVSALALAIAGCSTPFAGSRGPRGVVISPDGASANILPPDAMKHRAAYSGVMSGYNFQDVVGNILEVRTDGSGSSRVLDVYLPPPDFVPDVRAIDNPGLYYHSRIVRGAQAHASYLLFAADLAAQQMVDYTLADDAVATAGPLTSEICTGLVDWAARHPRTDTATRRIWVREVIRSQQTIVTYDTVGAGGGVQVGELVGVNGTVYRRSDQTSRSWVYGFTAYDIDAAAAQMQMMTLEVTDIDEFLAASRYTGVLTGSFGRCR